MKETLELINSVCKNVNPKKSVSFENTLLHYDYDESVSRYRYAFSFKNKHSILRLGDFFYYHVQQLLFIEKDEEKSDILFFVYVLISSLDVDREVEREKYFLIKNVLQDNVNFERVYKQILELHGINENDQELFTFKRTTKELQVFYKGNEIDIVAITVNYLDSLKATENNDLLLLIRTFTIEFLETPLTPNNDH